MDDASFVSRMTFGRGAEDPMPADAGPGKGLEAQEGADAVHGDVGPEHLRARQDAWWSSVDDCWEPKGTSPYDMSPREVGRLGERLAAGYLARRGFELLERNLVNAGGEADIVARDDDCVVLVEVKTRVARPDDVDVVPELAVTKDKRRRYRNIALAYLLEHERTECLRFDVIAIKVEGERQAHLRHLVGAFAWDL
ncbi:YraN family protein [Olsenella massiliensis]|uniref:YraN family protein n=1 Tax=Olsenella massiliensis TaxID=1622075 RepID=UPI00071DD020|nr:YraN family protein [Olsenella massiliensis]